MNFLKRLFKSNKKEPININTETIKKITQSDLFDREWESALDLFKKYVELPINNFVLKDPDTHLEIPPHVGLGGTFEDWKEIQSPWDRRCILFDCIVEYLQDKMQLWQIANYYTYTRMPSRALEGLLLEEENKPEIINNSGFTIAKVRALFSLSKVDESILLARKAVQQAPDNNDYKILLGDILHVNGDHEEAHKIYNEFIDIPNSLKDGVSLNEIFEDFFSIKSGKAPSFIMAINFSKSLKSKDETEFFWTLIENEFYHIPYCRLEHTYFLLENGEQQRALAKILSLVNDTPWLKEAHLNALQIIEMLDPSGVSLQQYREPLEQRIKENNWTPENMFSRVIGF